ncbi:hypothetical protein [Paenibacillus sp. FSL H3-0286]|uniref:hypothetical protein n=1 Tax=Paenibacillus sp. FSL H3-0286 TaxID=2921427 RepID=UPI003252E7E1
MTHRIWLKHIEGLPQTEINTQIVLSLNSQGIKFSSKQHIPFERIIGFEILHRRVVLKGSPVASALGYGVVSMFLGGLLFGLIFDNGEIPAIILGILGCLVGAIKGLQSTYKNKVFLKVFYRSVENVVSDITLLAAHNRDAISFAKHINQRVGYHPMNEVSSKSKKVYEI